MKNIILALLLVFAARGGAFAAPTVGQVWPQAWVTTATLSGVNITGANLAVAAVTLTKAGQPPITATNISVVNSTQITCSLPLTGAATGLWTLTVQNTDLSSATLPGGFLLAPNVPDNMRAWKPANPMPMARWDFSGTLLPDGNILAAGGASAGNALSDVDVYNSVTGTWMTPYEMGTKRMRHTATLLANGKVLVAGGNNGVSASASAELYDPASGTWTPTGSMTAAREFAAATLLPNGKVLVSGGFDSGALQSSELYDPVTGTWALTGNMAEVRYFHKATLLPKGKVLITGGLGAAGAIPTSELYNPVSGAWTPTGSLNTGREGNTATLLANGKVLVTGGRDISGNELSSAEIYDPAATIWTTTATMNFARTYHTATLLPNGKVLVFMTAPGGSSPSAELYDPAAGTWTVSGSINSERYGHSAILLPDGKVLIFGGNTLAGALSSAELYTGVMPISGTITSGSAGLGGVTVTLSGNASGTTTTAADGTFALNIEYADRFTLTPSLAGHNFLPVSISTTYPAGPLTWQNFTARTSAAPGAAGAVTVQGGENGYVEPKKGPATIRLASPATSGHVTVKIYTLRKARLVKTLETDVTAGTPASITWNCLNTDGEMIGSGTYLAVVNGAGYNNEKVKIGVLK